ncbi:MAG: hypothetical protein L2C94_007295 [Aigarchaeota archaeon]|nr:hypothetical protein [Candidatus Wolframiiraptor gerlachensis]
MKRCEIEIEKKDSGGIRLVVFGSLRANVREVEDLLRSVGIRNAVVRGSRRGQHRGLRRRS